MSKNIEMNYKTDSGYEILYPKTNSDQIQMSDGSGNLNEQSDYLYAKVGDVVNGSIRQSFTNKIFDNFLPTSGQILSSQNYEKFANEQGGLIGQEVQTVQFQGGIAYLQEWGEARNGVLVAIATNDSSQGQIYISKDNGVSYIFKTNLVQSNDAINSHLMLASNGDFYCFCGASQTIFKSVDNCETFSSYSGYVINNNKYKDIDGKVFSYDITGNTFFYTNDYGNSNWITVNAPNEINSQVSCVVDIIKKNNNYFIIYCAPLRSSGTGGYVYIYSTQDFQNMVQVSNFEYNGTKNINSYPAFLEDENLYYMFWGNNTYVSEDGVNWTIISTSENFVGDRQAYKYNNQFFVSGRYISTDDGLSWFTTHDFGSTYIMLNNGIILSYKRSGSTSWQEISFVSNDKILLPNIPNHYIRVK